MMKRKQLMCEECDQRWTMGYEGTWGPENDDDCGQCEKCGGKLVPTRRVKPVGPKQRIEFDKLINNKEIMDPEYYRHVWGYCKTQRHASEVLRQLRICVEMAEYDDGCGGWDDPNLINDDALAKVRNNPELMAIMDKIK